MPDLLAALLPVAAKVWAYCQRTGQSGRCVTLKVKYADFQQLTRSRTLPAAVLSEAALLRLGQDLLTALLPLPQGVRLLGLSLSALDEPDAATGQLALF
ncbi:MAG: hypothetical protein WKG07_31775 [Hymenobacter sp.]